MSYMTWRAITARPYAKAAAADAAAAAGDAGAEAGAGAVAAAAGAEVAVVEEEFVDDGLWVPFFKPNVTVGPGK